MKKLKINLLVDGVRCKNIEDIKENFNLLDVLEYFKNGKLIKWAKVRGFNELVDELESISKNKDLDIAKSLCDIFEIQTDEKELKDELNFYRVENKADIKNIAKIIPYLDKIEKIAKNEIDKIQNIIPYLEIIKELGENEDLEKLERLIKDKKNLVNMDNSEQSIENECKTLLLEISRILSYETQNNHLFKEFDGIKIDIARNRLILEAGGLNDKLKNKILDLFEQNKNTDSHWAGFRFSGLSNFQGAEIKLKCSEKGLKKLKQLRLILIRTLQQQEGNAYNNLLGFKGL